MSRQRALESGLPRLFADHRSKEARQYKRDLDRILARFPQARERCGDLLEAAGRAWIGLRETQRLQREAQAQPGRALEARTLLKRSSSALSRLLAVEREIARACRRYQGSARW